MKTMSRSLQMLNVARLNVKAQKNQAEAEQLGAEVRAPDRTGKRRSSERNKPDGTSAIRESKSSKFTRRNADRVSQSVTL